MSVDDGLRPIFRTNLNMMHIQSIETASTGGGVPDCNWCYRGVEGWVEFKSTRAWAVKFQIGQVAWIESRLRAQGRVHLMIRRRPRGAPGRGRPVDELWLLRGSAARSLASSGLRGAPRSAVLGVWSGGPGAGWDWDEVLALLCR